eukprot:602176-Pyramimonas_sp.AAC.1
MRDVCISTSSTAHSWRSSSRCSAARGATTPGRPELDGDTGPLLMPAAAPTAPPPSATTISGDDWERPFCLEGSE